MLFLMTDSPLKLRLEKIHGKDSGKNLVYVSPNSPQTSFLIKKTKNNHTSTSDSWEYIKNRFTENAKILSKNSTKQGNLQFQETICFVY